MRFETLRASQSEVVQILENGYRKDRLSHAYIFEGEKGTGKRAAALFFAAMLLCEAPENKPCGTCNTCRRIHNHTHPNVYQISPGKNQIVKENIRQLQNEFNKTALEEGAKIYIIEYADTMNAHAANALLKFLEEPHPNLYGLLLTEDARQLLPTIRSRSQKINFRPLSKQAILEHLTDAGYDEQLIKLAAALTHTTTAAEAFLDAPNLFDLIDATKMLYEALAQAQSLVIAFNDEVQSLLHTTQDTEMLLSLMICYHQDLIYMSMKHYQKIIFESEQATMANILEIKTKDMLIKELRHMLELKARLNHYINEKLACDNLMILLERRTERGI